MLHGQTFRRAAVLILVVVTTQFAHVSAQIDTGRISGTITDSTGAALPNARVSLENVNTNVIYAGRSNSTGTYVFEAVPPGLYQLRAQVANFKEFVASNLVVHVQDSLTINISMTPGSVTQRVMVTDAVPVLQTGDASFGEVVDSQAVNDLPLNGRNWASLAQLDAGVTTPAGAAPGSAIFVVDGLNFGQNDYRLNGIDDNVEVYGGTAFGTNASVTPPPDAIQEFKIQNGNYNAEFGHSTGGVINAVVRSGTNRVRGDLWEYLRNNIFDANDYFSNHYGLPIPSYRQNQFGGTIGGPIYIPRIYNGRDKTFFFFDYQGTRIVEASPSTSTVPTQSMRQSNFTNLRDLITDSSGVNTDALGRKFPFGTILDPATTRSVGANAIDPVTGLLNPTSNVVYVRDPFYTGGSVSGITDYTTLVQYLNQIPAARMDPNAVNLLKLYPAPNGPSLINNYLNNGKALQNINQADVRIDQNFGSHDVVFGVFDWDHIKYTTPPNLPGIATGQNFSAGETDGPHYAIAAGYTHVFSASLTNEFRFGYNHNGETIEPPDANTNGIPAQFGIAGIPQLPNNGGLSPINIGGLSGLGVSDYIPILATIWDMELQDNVTKVEGRHTFKGGYQLDSIEGDLTAPPWGRGQFTYSGQYTDIPNASTGFTGIGDLLLVPTAATVPNGISNNGGVSSYSGSDFQPTNDHRWYMGVYLQDDWKLTPTLTVNLGLRWDHTTPYAETSGRQANFIQAGGNGDTGTYYVPEKGCRVTRSSTFDALLASSNIRLDCVPGLALGNVQNFNFAPRVGFAYNVVRRLVVRGGFGIAYGALDNIGGGDNIGNNYPFEYTVNYQSPSSYQPLTLPDGSTATMENAFAASDIQNPSVVNGVGLQLFGRQLNFQTPYTETYNLTLQYELGSHDSAQVAYVGTAGRHLDSLGTHNAPTEILPPGTSIYQAIPFPNFAPNSGYETTNSTSNYNALQATYRHRFSAGMQLLANYTWSKCLTTQELNTGDFNSPPGFRAQWLPGFGIAPDYALCVADSTQVVHVSGIYQLPFGRDRRWLNGEPAAINGLIGGWQVNYIYTYQSGEPFTIPCPIATTSDFGCDANVIPGQNPYAGPHNADQWLNPDAFANPPVATTVGSTDYSVLGGPPQQVRGPGFRNLDFSLFKQFSLWRETTLQFRAEAFNLFNTPEFAEPAGDLDFTNKSGFSQITGLVNTPRLLQFAVKVLF